MAKLDMDELRRQQRAMMVLATHLRGAADRVQTREDACEAYCGIRNLDRVLVHHVRFEDEVLYPMIIAGPDREAAATAANCAEDFGAVLGAWQSYRDQWTASAILGAPERFATATAGIIGGLAMRVARETVEIHPAADNLAGSPERDFSAVL